MRLALLGILFGLVAACGDDHRAVDGGTGGDARSDATPAPDAEDRCHTLCACTMQFCSDTMATCLATCATLQDSVRECRIEHCGYAQTNPSFHCPHALGDPNAPGIPAACIQQ